MTLFTTQKFCRNAKYIRLKLTYTYRNIRLQELYCGNKLQTGKTLLTFCWIGNNWPSGLTPWIRAHCHTRFKYAWLKKYSVYTGLVESNPAWNILFFKHTSSVFFFAKFLSLVLSLYICHADSITSKQSRPFKQRVIFIFSKIVKS